jgi:DNA polymerase-3 subunit epsilon
MGSDNSDDLKRMAETLRASGRFQVLARIERRDSYNAHDGSSRKTALYVDVETTGFDTERDAIVQYSGVPFEYSPLTGKIYELGKSAIFFEYPGRPIPAEVTAKTGITDKMVAGQRIDDARVIETLGPVSLVIAHNAAFDRPFLERRLPAFCEKPWACSQTDVPWPDEGFDSVKLEYLLFKHCQMFYQAHRADEDCYAGIHLLATPLPSGELPLLLLLQSARQTTVRIWAVESAYEAKDTLKARRYTWNPGTDGRPKAWHIDVPEECVEQECAWLREHVYAGRTPPVKMDKLDARIRFSKRA